MRAAARAGRDPGRWRDVAIAIVACSVTALALLVAAPAGAGGYKKLRFGTIDAAVDPKADLARMGRADVKTFRTAFDWAKTEVVRGDPGRCNAVYDWSYLDQVVGHAGRRGVRLLPVIVGSPSYVPGAKTRANAPPTKSEAIDDYKCYVRALAKRYGRGGDYIRFDPEARPIREWQIWNEPSIPVFAPRGTVRPRDYGRLVKRSRAQLRAEDRKAGVVLGGIPERYRGGMNAKPFLRKLYKVKRIERRFNAVAVHLYARNYRGVKGGAQRMRRHLRRLGTGGKALWITETGWSTGGPDGSHPLVKNRKGQARQLRKTFRVLRNKRGRLKVGTVTWFRWRDAASPGGGKSHFDFAGLYTQGGKPKRSCRSFVRFTGGRCRPIEDGGSTARSSAVAPSERALDEPSGAEGRTLLSRPG